MHPTHFLMPRNKGLSSFDCDDSFHYTFVPFFFYLTYPHFFAQESDNDPNQRYTMKPFILSDSSKFNHQQMANDPFTFADLSCRPFGQKTSLSGKKQK